MYTYLRLIILQGNNYSIVHTTVVINVIQSWARDNTVALIPQVLGYIRNLILFHICWGQ